MKDLIVLLVCFWTISAVIENVEACSCLPSNNPVCGDDGITYPNPCILFCINFYRAQQGLPKIEILCNGTCESCKLPPCPCDKHSEPVCGEDGITYGNPCMFDCENKRRKFYGLPLLKLRCRARCDQCPPEYRCRCPLIYKPICGTDNNTYINDCFLGCENREREKLGLPKIEVRCNTTCEFCKPPSCPCTLEYEPVCGEDGKTYGNICEFNCENKRRKFYGLPLLKLRCKVQCKKCPPKDVCVCPYIYKPVCGTDNKTYSNDCLLRCENKRREKLGLTKIKVRCNSTCALCKPPDCPCDKQYDPVCGSDGKTYGNICLFNCENKRREFYGLPKLKLRCKKACNQCPIDCICTEEYAPVCGSDGKTYGNICKFNCENKRRALLHLPLIKIRCKHACKVCYEEEKRCTCPEKYSPVCGSDGVSYNNPCDVDCGNFHRELQGLPPITIICHNVCDACGADNCGCTKEYKPVCGSNNQTYSNKCVLDCENRHRKPPITINCTGKCPCSGKECTCPLNIDPVCGSDGKTYVNPCVFDCENKRRKSQGLPEILKNCKGKCPCPFEGCICPQVFIPVCGSDGKTYGNLCMFDCENKRRKFYGLPLLNLRCNVACNKCPPKVKCPCPKIYKPVCGTDNKTYSNDCLLRCENKRREKLGLPKIKVRCNSTCALCKPPDCPCDKQYDPVCGSDGKTYGNICLFNCENKRREFYGLPKLKLRCKNACNKCPIDCTCTEEYAPVCGSDGKTYGNICKFNCENKRRALLHLPLIKIRCKHACKVCYEEEKRCTCPEKYSPVCGSDGVSYNNPCDVDCGNFHRELQGLPPITIICHNVCDACGADNCGCTKEYKPVCGSNNQTYSNKCVLECENRHRKPPITINCTGKCPCSGKECTCPLNIDPVCGSDGKTYVNPCVFDCENKRRKSQGLPEILKNCKGKCPCPFEGCICPQVFIPVCGSDGKTYGNLCTFDCENKRRKFYGLPLLNLRCNVACNKCPPKVKCPCPKLYKPVCGTDNKTYSNDSLLRCENKRREQLGLPKIKVRCNSTCALCKPPDCPCNKQYDPVCGSDGKTYGNICLFNCENKKREFYGLPKLKLRCKKACNKCPIDCTCTEEYAPVCGSDGKTYGNICKFNCENKRRALLHLPLIKIRCKHACKVCYEEEKRCTCPEKYSPVCGSDGVSYNNPCDVDCGNFHRELQGLPPITIICHNVCDACGADNCGCTKEYKPVCGSNNQTYSNKCVLDCENRHRKPPITINCTGKCPCSGKECTCPLNIDPVCGSDGKTYVNPCVFDCENKRRKSQGLPEILKNCKGKCPCPFEGCICPQVFIPVCGSDGKTYGNLCMFDCENKRRKFYGLPLLNLRCNVACNKCPPKVKCPCPKLYKPVCGTDNKTYSNDCLLRCENKRREKLGLPKIKVRCNSTCALCKPPDCPCDKQYDPVCGSDGKTYGNICLFNCENKRREFYGLPKLKLRCKKACNQCPIDCVCTEEYAPVCGSDGKTYSNICKLNCENKRRALLHLPLIEIRCKHACNVCDEEEERCSCTKEYYPVCGSDGVSYNNLCDLDCSNFQRELQGLPPIKIICYNVCDICDDDICVCTAEFKPVCGSNNQTYSNTCILNCENRYRKPPITIKCKGDCPCSEGGSCTK